jgi:hypothetical protein
MDKINHLTTNTPYIDQWVGESTLPTYAEYTKDMSLADKFRFYFDTDINDTISAADMCGEMADALSSPTWLDEFELDFKNYLKERDYIR